jgi:hypothetical protein
MASSRRHEVLTGADGSRWDEVLDEIGSYDFCHLWRYNRLAEHFGQGRARLLVFREAERTIAFPLLLRELPGGAARCPGVAWQDVTSVYGYAGPLAAAIPVDEVRARFAGFVTDFLRQEQVVCAFSRLHPLLDQAPLLSGCGEVAPVGPTLSVDLTASEEEQWSAYRRNHRQDIKRLLSMGVTCEEAGLDDLDPFVAMYYDTMDRVGAAPDYYFPREYFARLLTEMPAVAHLYLCRDGGLPVAGGIFTICRGFVQWYLSGSRPGYEGPPPTKLMFDVARHWAMREGAHTLHLGGGVGGRQDSLYHFKRGFTHREHTYAMWRYIADREAYLKLCGQACREAGIEPDDSYFPLYRHPALHGGGGREKDPASIQSEAAPVRTG